MLIVFDNVITDMEANKKLSPILTELLIRVRKLNISIVFISKNYSKVLKDIRQYAAHYFIMKIPSKRELQQIAPNHLSDMSLKVS